MRRSIARAVRTFRTYSRDQREVVAIAAVLLPVVEVGLRLVGLRPIWRLLVGARPAAREDVAAAVAVGRAVDSAAHWSPARPGCLARSVVLCHVLHRRGLAADLRIGVAGTGADFEAHAWVEVAGQPIGDSAAQLEHFTPFDHPVPS